MGQDNDRFFFPEFGEFVWKVCVLERETGFFYSLDEILKKN